MRVGQAKVQEYTHTFIHYYDLNPIIIEINRLHIQSINLLININTNQNYSQETSNYVKILNLTKDKVEVKLKEIIPHPQRTKRGLINGLGSIFKSITGNLDASDGERYDNLIRQLQVNQNKLAGNIVKQNSISLEIINKFNETVQQIKHNEKLLQSKIEQIAIIAEQVGNWKKSIFINDILNQIINMYEIINSILQDIENSISFTKLNIMHPSIIKTTDFYNELLKLQETLKPGQLPLEVTLENTLLIENIIEIDCYIFNNKITYLLHLPIMYSETFNYYHLYSIPVYSQSQFKAIIPNDKYLIKNELYYAYQSDICRKIIPRYYICKKLNLQNIKTESPCEIQLLDVKNTSSCQKINIQVSKPILKQLEDTTQWIGIFPAKEIINLKCQQQEEILKLIGSYLINIPVGCHITTSQRKVISNDEQTINANQAIFFPELDQERKETPKPNWSIHLENTKLDELHDIKRQILENQPQLSFTDGISHFPSSWTIVLYIFIILTVCYFCYKKCTIPNRCLKGRKENQNTVVELPNVQLPRCTP